MSDENAIKDCAALALPEVRALQGGPLLPAVARDHRAGGWKWPDLPRLRSAGRVARDHCRRASCVGLFLGLAFSAQAQAQAQDFGPGVTTAQQTLADLWTALQQARTLLATAQQQGAVDTATILALRTQIAALQAQLAGVPACPPVVICPVCPAPVVCPAPPPPPVVVPPPPLPTGAAALAWDAVAGATNYRVYYGTASRSYLQPLGQGISVLGTTFTVSGLASGVRYFFAVTAQNAVAESVFSNEVFKDIGVVAPPLVADTTPPTVSITAPGLGATVVGTIPLTANASDNVGVVGVQFGLDGASYALEITAPPYTTIWNSTTVADGTHTLNAVARDAAGNRASSALVSVRVANTPAPPPTGASVDCTRMPPAGQLIDGGGAVFTLVPIAGAQPQIWRDGAKVTNALSDFATIKAGTVCQFDDGAWECWSGAAPPVGKWTPSAAVICP